MKKNVQLIYYFLFFFNFNSCSQQQNSQNENCPVFFPNLNLCAAVSVSENGTTPIQLKSIPSTFAGSFFLKIWKFGDYEKLNILLDNDPTIQLKGGFCQNCWKKGEISTEPNQTFLISLKQPTFFAPGHWELEISIKTNEITESGNYPFEVQ